MKKAKSFFANLALAISGCFFFCLSHPNYLRKEGLPFFAFFALVPFFLLIKRTKIRFSFFWGAFAGCLSYFIFNFWLFYFHPIAIFVVLFHSGVIYGFLFLTLKIIDDNLGRLQTTVRVFQTLHLKKAGFLFFAIAWVAFEYLKTLGFLGYPYGIIGYTQWSFPALIRVSSIFGVWGVSFLLAVSSSLIAEIIAAKIATRGGESILCKSGFFVKAFFCWLGMFFAVIIFGVFTKIDVSSGERAKIALIQPNMDPWLGNSEVYRQNFYELKKLSQKAIEAEPDLRLIVWPETAFIPRIKWHYRYSENSASTLLVRELLNFIDGQSVPFLIGNDDAVFDENLSNAGRREAGRVDYNAALLFIPKKTVLPPEPKTYRKMHLVPFTEHFPYKNVFPKTHQFLLESDTHFWEKGDKKTVFELDNLKFSTPICFEDCFGYISKDFAKNGANLIINLTNDAWAKSVVSQYQHLSMAVFRAVENRIPVLRAASSGQTAHIDQNGVPVSMLEPFVSDFLIAEVSVPKKMRSSIYSVFGDWFAILCLLITAILLSIIFIINVNNKGSLRIKYEK